MAPHGEGAYLAMHIGDEHFLQKLRNNLVQQGQNFANDLASNSLDAHSYGNHANPHANFRQQGSTLWQSFVRIFSGIIEISQIYQNLWTFSADFLWGAIGGFFGLIHVTAAFIFGGILAFICWAKDFCLELGLLLLWASLIYMHSLCSYWITGILPGGIQYGTTSLLCIWVGAWAFRLLQKYLLPNLVVTLFSIVNYTPVLVSLLIVVTLQPFTQAFLLDYIELLKAEPWWLAFLGLFWWKSVKILVHTYSYVFLTEGNLYKPALYPKFTSKDVTVIIPSVGDFGKEFKKTIKTIIGNRPGKIIVSTAKLENLPKAQKACHDIELEAGLQSGTIIVTAVNFPNKRSQFIHAVKKVETPIICYADDHVFWPVTFLKHALAPFEDPLVGLVGTVKRVERVKHGSFKDRLLNYIAIMYLERHNFECTASYNLDGGVFVISGRTALTRTEIMHSDEFRQGFLDEKWWWGTIGPMKVDDDNYTTRFMVNNGYKTVFHNEPAALMHTTLGVEGGYRKFAGQLIRWVRTTWRSNPTSLFADRKIWCAHPWTTFSMMVTLFFNISLIYDPALFITLCYAGYLREFWVWLVLFLVVSKTIKQIPHLLRNPDDILPFWMFGMFFGYAHSLFKIWALFTAKNIEWTGRPDVDPVARPKMERGITSGLASKGMLTPTGINRNPYSDELVIANSPSNNWNFVGTIKRTASGLLLDVGTLKRTASGLLQDAKNAFTA